MAGVDSFSSSSVTPSHYHEGVSWWPPHLLHLLSLVNTLIASNMKPWKWESTCLHTEVFPPLCWENRTWGWRWVNTESFGYKTKRVLVQAYCYRSWDVPEPSGCSSIPVSPELWSIHCCQMTPTHRGVGGFWGASGGLGQRGQVLYVRVHSYSSWDWDRSLNYMSKGQKTAPLLNY